MTPEQLIGFIERKLDEHSLTKKVLPDADIVNAQFRRDIRYKLSSSLKSYFEQMLDLDGLTEMAINEIYKRFKCDMVRYHHVLKKKLTSNPAELWSEIIEREAAKVASKLKHHNVDMIKKFAIKELTGRLNAVVQPLSSLNAVVQPLSSIEELNLPMVVMVGDKPTSLRRGDLN